MTRVRTNVSCLTKLTLFYFQLLYDLYLFISLCREISLKNKHWLSKCDWKKKFYEYQFCHKELLAIDFLKWFFYSKFTFIACCMFFFLLSSGFVCSPKINVQSLSLNKEKCNKRHHLIVDGGRKKDK